MHRRAIGIIACVLLLIAAMMWMWPLASEFHLGLEAACWRVGALMAVLWMAYPDLKRLPGWMLVLVPVMLIAIAFKPRRAIYVLPILLLIMLLRPRAKRKG